MNILCENDKFCFRLENCNLLEFVKLSKRAHTNMQELLGFVPIFKGLVWF